MNIKKLFIIAAITLQFSTLIQADQAAWNAAFLSFGGGSDPKIAAANIKKDSMPGMTALKAAQPKGKKVSDELDAVGSFVANSRKNLFKSSFTDADVERALRVAQGLEADTSASNSSAALSDAIQANWTTAFAAFGTAQAIFDKTVAQKTMPASLTSTSAAYKNAQVIVQYLGTAPTLKGDYSGILNGTDQANFKTALTTAGVNITVQGTGTPNLTAKQTNGAALQQQILDAQKTFNLLVPNTYDTSKPLIPAASLPA